MSPSSRSSPPLSFLPPMNSKNPGRAHQCGQLPASGPASERWSRRSTREDFWSKRWCLSHSGCGSHRTDQCFETELDALQVKDPKTYWDFWTRLKSGVEYYAGRTPFARDFQRASRHVKPALDIYVREIFAKDGLKARRCDEGELRNCDKDCNARRGGQRDEGK